MLSRLRDNWVYGGFLAALLLLALTPVLSASWPLPLTLVWLQLPLYMLHQYEEHDGDRFRRFVNGTVGGGREVLTRGDTFVINILGVWGLNGAVFVLVAEGYTGLGTIAVYLSLVNGIGHCVQAIALGRYNPGLVTSALLFLPLGIVTLGMLGLSPGVTAGDHLIGLGAALLVHALIIARVAIRKRQLMKREI